MEATRDHLFETKTFPATEKSPEFEIRWITPKDRKSRVPGTEGWKDPVSNVVTKELGRTWLQKRSFLAKFCAKYFLNPVADENVSTNLANDRYDTFVGYVVTAEDRVRYTEPVAYMMVDTRTARGTAADLVYLCTHPSYHGKGYGRRLLSYYEDLVKRLDDSVTFIIIESMNTESTRRFYEHAGYRYDYGAEQTPAFPDDVVRAFATRREKGYVAFDTWKAAARERWGKNRDVPLTIFMHKQIRPLANPFQFATARHLAWVSSSLKKISI